MRLDVCVHGAWALLLHACQEWGDLPGVDAAPQTLQPVQVVYYDETAVCKLADAGVVLFQSQETFEFVSPYVSLSDLGELLW